MRRHLAAAIVLALAAGCGGDGSSGGGLGSSGLSPTIDPVSTFSAAEAVPPAAAASGAVDLATQAATNVILDDFTGGEATDAPHAFLSPPEFQLSLEFEREIDLDSAGRSSQDRFPNLSGILLITATATLQGNYLAGEAAYSLLVEAGTDITAVDPDSGIETLIPQGSNFSFDLAVTWEVTDSQNWTVVSTATKAVSVEGLTVTDGDSVTSVDVTGSREVVSSISKVDGEIVKERTISGSFTITIDDGVSVVEVLIEFDNDGLITVTIGGEVFGPFTPAEFRQFVQDNLAV